MQHLNPQGEPLGPGTWRIPTRVEGPTGPRPHLRHLGHLVPVVREGLIESYLRWADDAQDDFAVWLGPKPHVIAVRPESVRRVLTDDDHFLRNVRPTRHLFHNGILRLEGDVWRERRALFNPTFRRDSINEVVPIVQQETDRLIAAWSEDGQGIRPARDLSLVMLRILGRFIFGFDFEEHGYVGKDMHRGLIALTNNSVLTHLAGRAVAWAVTGKEVKRAQRWFDEACAVVLEKAADTPFMSALRAALADGRLTRNTAIHEIRGMLASGHETSATAIAWCVASLAMHPERSGPVAAEGQAALAAKNVADVRKLAATQRWCKEAMRMYPPVPLSVSQAVRDTTLGSLEVPRGTRVDVCAYVLHMSQSHWKHPEQFDPDRFLRPPATGTFIPFLIGPHVCLGKHLAMVELPIVTARLAEAFEFGLPNGPPERHLRISLHPKGFVADVRRR
ncbi:MAG: cytochrome P450 [Myxococcales bacterium]|nr:cytochrome P450 [Myxococcales bacterium]